MTEVSGVGNLQTLKLAGRATRYFAFTMIPSIVPRSFEAEQRCSWEPQNNMRRLRGKYRPQKDGLELVEDYKIVSVMDWMDHGRSFLD